MASNEADNLNYLGQAHHTASSKFYSKSLLRDGADNLNLSSHLKHFNIN